jgi:hypothetical protein
MNPANTARGWRAKQALSTGTIALADAGLPPTNSDLRFRALWQEYYDKRRDSDDVAPPGPAMLAPAFTSRGPLARSRLGLL